MIRIIDRKRAHAGHISYATLRLAICHCLQAARSATRVEFSSWPDRFCPEPFPLGGIQKSAHEPRPWRFTRPAFPSLPCRTRQPEPVPVAEAAGGTGVSGRPGENGGHRIAPPARGSSRGPRQGTQNAKAPAPGIWGWGRARGRRWGTRPDAPHYQRAAHILVPTCRPMRHEKGQPEGRPRFCHLSTVRTLATTNSSRLGKADFRGKVAPQAGRANRDFTNSCADKASDALGVVDEIALPALGPGRPRFPRGSSDTPASAACCAGPKALFGSNLTLWPPRRGLMVSHWPFQLGYFASLAACAPPTITISAAAATNTPGRAP
jgi:hypothetical protein